MTLEERYEVTRLVLAVRKFYESVTPNSDNYIGGEEYIVLQDATDKVSHILTTEYAQNQN